MNRLFLFSLSLSFSLFFTFSAQAQGVPTDIGGLSLTSSSDNPAPGQTVTITARSYSIDINSAVLTWIVDGKTAQKGQGLTTFKLQAPELGKTSLIEVSAQSPNGIGFSSSISISSGSVDMIVENNGYVPPFFKGKLPVTYQNTVRIIAIPHIADSRGVEYDPKTLIYQWKKNSRVVEDQSGYGKQSFVLEGDIVPRTTTISVTATTRDGSRRTSGYTSISYNSPSLAFYIDNPLYGALFNIATGNEIFIGKEKETSVLAVPYGFSKPVTGIGNLNLTWMINGFESPDLSKNESITLRAPEGSSGTSNISLSIRNSREILQSANSSLSVKFGSNQ